MRYASRDGHLRAQLQTDDSGQEQLHIQDHRGNLLDVLVKEELAAAAGGSSPEPSGSTQMPHESEATDEGAA